MTAKMNSITDYPKDRSERILRRSATVLTSILLLFSAASYGNEPFRISHPTPAILRLLEGDTAVWDYVFAPVGHPSVDPADPRFRAGCYFHPLYGFNGEILTVNATPWDNHAHHHGLWTSFTTVNLLRGAGTEHYDTWTDNTPLKRDFIRFQEQKITKEGFFFRVTNGWFLSAADNAKNDSAVTDTASPPAEREQVAEEILDVLTGPTRTDPVAGRWRTLDFTWRFRPLENRLEVAGDRVYNKDFSSMAIRFLPPAQKPRILSDEGEIVEDAMSIPRRWVAYQSDFDTDRVRLAADHPEFLKEDPSLTLPAERENSLVPPPSTAGAAIFPSPENPPFQGGWAIRHYGLIVTGWPGTAGVVLNPGEPPVTLRYRLLLYEKPLDVDDLARFYDDYLRQIATDKRDPPSSDGDNGDSVNTDGEIRP